MALPEFSAFQPVGFGDAEPESGDQRIAGPPDPEPTGDELILAAFREWQGVWRCAELAQPLVDAIAETPASGFAGVCVKTFLAFRTSSSGADDDDGINEAMSASVTQDIARLVSQQVPELAILCTPLALADDEEAQP
jgi:hypothetical protein